jgi:CheY-like chemotaxis protein
MYSLHAQRIDHYVAPGAQWYVSVSDYEMPPDVLERALKMFPRHRAIDQPFDYRSARGAAIRHRKRPEWRGISIFTTGGSRHWTIVGPDAIACGVDRKVVGDRYQSWVCPRRTLRVTCLQPARRNERAMFPASAHALWSASLRKAQVRKKLLVAIVDDDQSMRETTKDLLESAGFSAVAFASAASLLNSPRLSHVGCLISDMRMPGMTGLELHRHLVATNRFVPTIIITAHPDERLREEVLSAKVVCYLVKPFPAEELIECVRFATGDRERANH